MGHLSVEGGEVVGGELAQVVVPARAREHLHQLDRRAQEAVQSVRGFVDRQSSAQVRLLGGDADRTVVRVAGAHAEATDGLDRRVRHCDRIGSERERLGKVRSVAQPSGGHQGDVTAVAAIEVKPGASQRGDRRDADVVPEQQRCSPRATTAAVEDDVVDTDGQRRVEVLLEVLRRQLEPDRDAAGLLAHVVGEAPEVVEGGPVRKAGW